MLVIKVLVTAVALAVLSVALLALGLGVLTLWGRSTVTPENINHAPLLLPPPVGWLLVVTGVLGTVGSIRRLLRTWWRHGRRR